MSGSAAEPDAACRSPLRYLWWLVAQQPRRVVAGALLGSTWMVGLMLPPYLLARVTDDGLARGDTRALIGWTAALLGAGILNAWLGIMRHRTMTRVRMDALFRTVELVVAQATRLGAALPRRVHAGEVATIGVNDIGVIARTLTITGPGVGALIAFVVAGVLLLDVSPVLAAVVLLGVPLLVVVVGPLLGRLRGIETTYRDRQSALTARFADIVAGLRVLNGVGGKDVFAGLYRGDSRRLLAQGYRAGAVASWVQALGAGLPTVFLAVVTWLAARLAAAGTISIGDLVAVYGYAAVLVVPVATVVEGGYDLNHGLVAARRVVDLLSMHPDVRTDGAALPAPAGPAVLHDPDSGVRVAPGESTALVGARPAETAAVLDRLGRFSDSTATWGGVRLDRIALPQVRERIVLADNEADLFAGVLRDVLSGRCDPSTEALEHAVRAAVATDVVDGLPDGLDSPVHAQGRNLSGGQRQRVRLARVLLADPEVLLAVDPTSAVDAHTEARMAAQLRAVRAGRTTVVTTSSPLLLGQVDVVHHLVDGRVVATGTHRELLAGEPGYRRLVSRALDDETGEAGDEGEDADDGDGLPAGGPR